MRRPLVVVGWTAAACATLALGAAVLYFVTHAIAARWGFAGVIGFWAVLGAVVVGARVNQIVGRP